MEFIIDFFRGIDGWIYYTMLVINTILIFAIIGYLGEKNNEQLMKLGMNTSTPDLKNGAMNLTPVHKSPTSDAVSIPKISATQANNIQNNQGAQTVTSAANTNSTPVLPQQNTKQVATPIADLASGSSSAIPTINTATSTNVNEVAQNEKAPGILIINSSDVNKDVK